MPKSRRDILKRKVDQSVGCIENAQEHLLDLRLEYDPLYPQYVSALDTLITLLDTAKDFIRSFRAKV